MINNDVAPLIKETDQELLDEMIVKDVPESESSTDPVKKFEEANPIAGIDSIQEDQEDASDSECKDQSLNILALATSTPHKSHDTLSFNKSSSEPSPEMPKLIQQSRALINIQSPSSSDTKSESDHEKSRHSSADHSETSENRDIAE